MTAAVDVQDTYLAYEVVGWGKGRESWGIEAGEFQGNPHLLPDPNRPNQSPWEQIDRFVFNRIFRYEDGRFARVRLCFVDSGGHATTSVYKYTKLRQPRVLAIKGVGGPDRPMVIGGKLRERAEGCWLLRLGVDTLKDELHARLAVETPGPGFCHWPCGPNGEDVQGYGEGYFRQLIAEQRVLKYSKGGFAKFEWHKNRTDANEAFDLRCYAPRRPRVPPTSARKHATRLHYRGQARSTSTAWRSVSGDESSSIAVNCAALRSGEQDCNAAPPAVQACPHRNPSNGSPRKILLPRRRCRRAAVEAVTGHLAIFFEVWCAT